MGIKEFLKALSILGAMVGFIALVVVVLVLILSPLAKRLDSPNICNIFVVKSAWIDLRVFKIGEYMMTIDHGRIMEITGRGRKRINCKACYFGR